MQIDPPSLPFSNAASQTPDTPVAGTPLKKGKLYEPKFQLLHPFDDIDEYIRTHRIAPRRLGRRLTSLGALKPIGVGSAEVESLNSYVQRPYWAHGGMPRQLVHRVLRGLDQRDYESVSKWALRLGQLRIGFNYNRFSLADTWIRLIQRAGVQDQTRKEGPPAKSLGAAPSIPEWEHDLHCNAAWPTDASDTLFLARASSPRTTRHASAARQGALFLRSCAPDASSGPNNLNRPYWPTFGGAIARHRKAVF